LERRAGTIFFKSIVKAATIVKACASFCINRRRSISRWKVSGISESSSLEVEKIKPKNAS